MEYIAIKKEKVTALGLSPAGFRNVGDNCILSAMALQYIQIPGTSVKEKAESTDSVYFADKNQLLKFIEENEQY